MPTIIGRCLKPTAHCNESQLIVDSTYLPPTATSPYCRAKYVMYNYVCAFGVYGLKVCGLCLRGFRPAEMALLIHYCKAPWFTLEIVVKLAGCPSKLDFCKDVKNLIDVGAVLPYYVTLVNVLSTIRCSGR